VRDPEKTLSCPCVVREYPGAHTGEDPAPSRTLSEL
jgi:hypothetical protein